MRSCLVWCCWIGLAAFAKCQLNSLVAFLPATVYRSVGSSAGWNPVADHLPSLLSLLGPGRGCPPMVYIFWRDSFCHPQHVSEIPRVVCWVWCRCHPSFCEICKKLGHNSRACPLDGPCRRCHQPGHHGLSILLCG